MLRHKMTIVVITPYEFERLDNFSVAKAELVFQTIW